MLQAMRCALFQPDRTRSGMVTPSVMPDVPGTPFRVPPVPSTPGPQNQPEMSEKDSQHEDFGWEQVGGERDIFSPVESVVSLAQPEVHANNAADTASETTEEASEQSTSDSDAESVQPPDVPAVEPSCRFFINEKSLVIHCERSEGVLRCGRKISPHFAVVYELHGIRCSRCFDL